MVAWELAERKVRTAWVAEDQGIAIPALTCLHLDFYVKKPQTYMS
jgi:hypothetical protein